MLDTAKQYRVQDDAEEADGAPVVAAGIGKVELDGENVAAAKNRLQGPQLHWRTLSLRPRPTPA
jgi:hypothetical protein